MNIKAGNTLITHAVVLRIGLRSLRWEDARVRVLARL